LVKHLAPVYQTAGALLTNKWFDTTSRLPTAEDYKQFYVFSKGKTPELIQALGSNAGLVLAVTPSPVQHKGRVFVLTSRRTASACEPTVYALKNAPNVTVIGERTAGAMLSSGAYYLQSGFLLTLPVADYYTVDGVRLEGNGVQPDIAVPATDALDRALTIIGKVQQ
jgi:C-terminal processing protease CtpA/Prc